MGFFLDFSELFRLFKFSLRVSLAIYRFSLWLFGIFEIFSGIFWGFLRFFEDFSVFWRFKSLSAFFYDLRRFPEFLRILCFSEFLVFFRFFLGFLRLFGTFIKGILNIFVKSFSMFLTFFRISGDFPHFWHFSRKFGVILGFSVFFWEFRDILSFSGLYEIFRTFRDFWDFTGFLGFFLGFFGFWAFFKIFGIFWYFFLKADVSCCEIWSDILLYMLWNMIKKWSLIDYNWVILEREDFCENFTKMWILKCKLSHLHLSP